MILRSVFTYASLKSSEDRIQHFDALAQSYCAARVTGSEWAFAVYRDCTNNPPTCTDICETYKTQMLTAIGNQRTKYEHVL